MKKNIGYLEIFSNRPFDTPYSIKRYVGYSQALRKASPGTAGRTVWGKCICNLARSLLITILFMITGQSIYAMENWDQGTYYIAKMFDDYYESLGSAQNNHYKSLESKKELSRYGSIMRDESRKKIRGQLLFTSTFTTENAFNVCGDEISLSRHLFGDRPWLLSEIFLPAKLANEGFTVADAESPSKQYLPYIANSELYFDAQLAQTTLDLTMSMEMPLWSESKCNLIIGSNLPFVFERRVLDFTLRGGSLSQPFSVGFDPEIALFYKEFNSSQDFVEAFALRECKDLCYQRERNTVSFGDYGIFLGVDFGSYYNEESQAVLGINVLMPTSKKQEGKILWEPEVGKGGAWTISPFLQSSIHINNYINPTIHASGFFSPSFNAIRRVPQYKQLKEEVAGGDTNLCFPATFDCALIKPFCFVDSLSAPLADDAACVCIKRGYGGMIRIGNIVQDPFDIQSLQFGVYYMGSFKRGDNISVRRIKEQQESPFEETNDNQIQTVGFDTSSLNETRRSHAHLLEWNIAYQLSEYIGASVGSIHMIAGKNIIRRNMLVANVMGYF